MVDDRPDNLLALRAVLDPLGLELVEASSGEAALRWLLAEEFALIVLDVQMPGMDGFETATLIRGRERTRHVPIIFLTAIAGQPEHYLRGYSSGAVDYVYKPFEPEILRAKVSIFAELWARGATIEAQRQQLADRVDELDRARASLARQAEELERSNAALDRLAQVAATEIREPLHTVAGFLDLLLADDGGLLAERAAAGVARMQQRVGGLLEEARWSAGVLVAVPVSLAEALEEARAAVGATVVQVTDLPTVMGDREGLVRLFAGLLERDVSAGEKPEVRVDAERADGERWRISVTCAGIGVDPAEIGRRFTVFARDADVSHAICRRIVERHGGTIWAEAGPEGVTAVRFDLPDIAVGPAPQ